MRRRPAPLNVTNPPPSMTTRGLVFTTFAVALILIVTGSGPQANRMIPPAATAATTAAEVQLAGVPRPTTRLGRELSTGRPPAGTGTERTPAADRAGSERAADAMWAPPTSWQQHATRSSVRRGTAKGYVRGHGAAAIRPRSSRMIDPHGRPFRADGAGDVPAASNAGRGRQRPRRGVGTRRPRC